MFHVKHFPDTTDLTMFVVRIRIVRANIFAWIAVEYILLTNLKRLWL